MELEKENQTLEHMLLGGATEKKVGNKRWKIHTLQEKLGTVEKDLKMAERKGTTLIAYIDCDEDTVDYLRREGKFSGSVSMMNQPNEAKATTEPRPRHGRGQYQKFN